MSYVSCPSTRASPRSWWPVAVANVRSRRVAEKAGARFEAVLRKRFILGGVPVDAALYSFVRPD